MGRPSGPDSTSRPQSEDWVRFL